MSNYEFFVTFSPFSRPIPVCSADKLAQQAVGGHDRPWQRREGGEAAAQLPQARGVAVACIFLV